VGVNSIPTSLAVFWGEEVRRGPGGARAEEPLQSLAAASDKLTADFGTWKTPWGEINRFQRLNGDIAPRFDDAGPSIPVASHPRSGARWRHSEPAPTRDQAVVWQQREQLRGGGGVRQDRAGQGGDGRGS